MDHCQQCSKPILPSAPGHIFDGQIVCGDCDRAARFGANVAPRSAVAVAPQYFALRAAAMIIMGCGFVGAVASVVVGVYGVAIAVAQYQPAAPVLFYILYGVVSSLFAIAFGQLLLAVRDIAVNSFRAHA